MDNPINHSGNNPGKLTGLVEQDQQIRSDDDVNADIIIITHENVGEKMAGPGIRSWEIARCLGEKNHRVILATPYASNRQANNVDIQQFTWDDPVSINRLIERASVIFSTGPAITRVFHLLGHPVEKPTVVDIYDIAEIERILHSILSDDHNQEISPVIIDELFTYLRYGDFFVCSSERQYDFWSGALLAVGRINRKTLGPDFSIDDLIDIVPMGMPDDPPQRAEPFFRGKVPGIGDEDIIIYWGGGIWDWTDPFTLLDALDILITSRDDIRVIFGALHHFDTDIVPEMSAASKLLDLIQQKGWLNQRVFFGDWIPYDERGSLLLEVDIGISLNSPTIENRYAARARLMDYWWADLPCIVSRGDVIADLLGKVGLARVIEPGDSVALAEAITDIMNNKNGLQSQAASSDDGKSRYYWSNVVSPIHNFLRDPKFAADAKESREHLRYVMPLRREWEQIREINRELNIENSQLQARALELSSENTRLLETNQILSAERNEQAARHQVFSAEHAVLLTQYESLLSQLHALQKKYDATLWKFDRLKIKYKKSKLMQHNLQKDKLGLMGDRDRLNAEIQALDSQNRHLRQSIIVERERLRAEVFQLETEYKHQINLYRKRKVVRLADTLSTLFRRK